MYHNLPTNNHLRRIRLFMKTLLVILKPNLKFLPLITNGLFTFLTFLPKPATPLTNIGPYFVLMVEKVLEI